MSVGILGSHWLGNLIDVFPIRVLMGPCVSKIVGSVKTRAAFSLQCLRWSSKKAAGSSRNGRKTAGRRLGLKCGNGKLCGAVL